MLPIAQLPTPLPEVRSASAMSGDRIMVNGRAVSAAALAVSSARSTVPSVAAAESLEARLGFGGAAALVATRWSGMDGAFVDTIPTTTLGDEVGLEVGTGCRPRGAQHAVGRKAGAAAAGAPATAAARKGSTANRLVLDLSGPVCAAATRPAAGSEQQPITASATGGIRLGPRANRRGIAAQAGDPPKPHPGRSLARRLRRHQRSPIGGRSRSALTSPPR